VETVGDRGERKVRSDKKRDVKPVIPVHLKKNIYRLSDICDLPVKDIAVILCAEGIQSKEVMGLLKPNFRRGVRLGNTIYFGSLDNPSLQRKKDKSFHERITAKFTTDDFENIGLLAFALDVTPSRAVAILLSASIRDPDFIHTLMRNYSKRKRLTEEHQTELKKVMKYINSENPYKTVIAWADMLMYVGDFVVNGWRRVE